MSVPGEHIEADTGFDLDASIGGIASSMGLKVPDYDAPEPDTEVATDPKAAQSGTTDPAKAAAVDPNAVVVRPPPKSWAKEKHEMWGKLPVDAQEYYETREKQFLDGLEQYKGDAGYAKQLREIITPYRATLAAQGISEPQAVQYLLNAHYQLTNGTAEERAAAYRQIGTDLGLIAEAAEDPNALPVDPAVKQLADKVQKLEGERTAEQEQKFREARQRADAETNVFYADAKNIYLSEVANDMVPLIKMGHSLEEAYKKAVWGNPVTREKELARIQTEAAEKLKADAKTEAETARRATSTNVRTTDNRRAPTEPHGKMFEDMHETLAKIKARH